jgi:hypothetical protein
MAAHQVVRRLDAVIQQIAARFFELRHLLWMLARPKGGASFGIRSRGGKRRGAGGCHDEGHCGSRDGAGTAETVECLSDSHSLFSLAGWCSRIGALPDAKDLATFTHLPCQEHNQLNYL